MSHCSFTNFTRMPVNTNGTRHSSQCLLQCNELDWVIHPQKYPTHTGILFWKFYKGVDYGVLAHGMVFPTWPFLSLFHDFTWWDSWIHEMGGCAHLHIGRWDWRLVVSFQRPGGQASHTVYFVSTTKPEDISWYSHLYQTKLCLSYLDNKLCAILQHGYSLCRHALFTRLYEKDIGYREEF